MNIWNRTTDYSIASQETVTESWQPFLVEGKAYYQK